MCPDLKTSSPYAQAASDCSTCPAGYYCKAGIQTACTGVTTYCPQGVSAPVPATSGYYSILTSTNVGFLSTSQSICDLGYYCINASKYKCPKGTYGSTTGLISPSCSGQCTGGYFCDEGSTSPTSLPCGLASPGKYLDNDINAAKYYCPAGTASILIAADGKYTTPEDQLYAHRSGGDGLCSTGTTCINGVKSPTLQWAGPCSSVGNAYTLEVDAIRNGGAFGTLRLIGSRSFITADSTDSSSFLSITYLQADSSDPVTVSISSELDSKKFTLFGRTFAKDGFGIRTNTTLDFEARFLSGQSGPFTPYKLILKAQNKAYAISCTLTINTIQVNLPPVLPTSWSVPFEIPQGTVAGTVFGDPLIGISESKRAKCNFS